MVEIPPDLLGSGGCYRDPATNPSGNLSRFRQHSLPFFFRIHQAESKLQGIRKANSGYLKKLLDSFVQLPVKIIALTDKTLKRFRGDSFAFYKFAYGILVSGKDLTGLDVTHASHERWESPTSLPHASPTRHRTTSHRKKCSSVIQRFIGQLHTFEIDYIDAWVSARF